MKMGGCFILGKVMSKAAGPITKKRSGALSNAGSARKWYCKNDLRVGLGKFLGFIGLTSGVGARLCLETLHRLAAARAGGRLADLAQPSWARFPHTYWENIDEPRSPVSRHGYAACAVGTWCGCSAGNADSTFDGW